jgi:hypothetical protein
VSTTADIIAVSGYFKRCLKPEPWIEGGKDRPTRGEMTFLGDYATMTTWLPKIYPGTPETVVVQGQSVTRSVPLKHPDFPTLLATAYRPTYKWGKLATVTQGTGHEALVFLTVTFEEPPFGLTGDDPYQSVSARGFREEIPVEASFSGGGTPAFDTTKPVNGLDYSITVYDAPGIDSTTEALWAGAAGKVNADPWRNHAAGYALFDYPQFNYVYKFGGVRTCTYTLNIRARSLPWTQTYKRDGTAGTLQMNSANVIGSVAFASLWK